MQKSAPYLQHPSWRRVISQLRETFNELHLKVESLWDEDKTRSENLSLSDICLEANQNYINAIENECRVLPEDTDEDYAFKDSFRVILKVWKLCQIIFIKSSPPGALLIDLQEWYRSTNNIDPMVQSLFSTHSDPEMISQDQNYWLLILISVAQGRIETARHLLGFHPSKNTSVFKSIDEQLRTMPNFSQLGHLSLFEFKAKWEYWQKKCVQVLTNEDFTTEESTGSLEIICKILCADESTFLELKPIFGNWYYMLISLVSYSNPTFNISDLHLHLSSKTCMKQFENELDEFDTIIHNIFDFDVESVIKDCVEMNPMNIVFSAHLMDILYLNGKLQLNKKELSMTVGVESNSHMAGSSGHGSENKTILHEEHLSAYATQLLKAFGWSSPISIYQISFDYLMKCRIDKYGIQLIEEFMEKIQLKNISELEANKLFHLAYEFKFHDLAFGVGRCMQMRALKNGQYGTALGWNVRIKDTHFGTVLAEKIVEKYWTTEDLNLLDLTENLTKEIIYCDRLIFMTKYRDFLKLTRYSNTPKGSARKMSELKQSSTIFVQLLEANNLVPLKYRRKLLMDTLPLVKENALSEEQIFSVLRSIQNHENRISFFDEKKTVENQNKKMSKDLNILDVEASYPIYSKSTSNDSDFVYNLDNMKWQELILELSEKLSDTVSLKSVEISN